MNLTTAMTVTLFTIWVAVEQAIFVVANRSKGTRAYLGSITQESGVRYLLVALIGLWLLQSTEVADWHVRVCGALILTSRCSYIFWMTRKISWVHALSTQLSLASIAALLVSFCLTQY
jgi:hypothetical protein